MCIRDRPKIHKDNVPIRHVVNFKTPPSYKVAKGTIKDSISLKNNRSIKTTIEFMNKLKRIKLQDNYKIASFDVVRPEGIRV